MASGLRSRKSDSALTGDKENDSLTANRRHSTNEGKLSVTQSLPAATTSEAPIFATYLRNANNEAALSCPGLTFHGANNATRFKNGLIAHTTMCNAGTRSYGDAGKKIGASGSATNISTSAEENTSNVPCDEQPTERTRVSRSSTSPNNSSMGFTAPSSTASDHIMISTSGGLAHNGIVPVTSSQIGSVRYTVSGSSGSADVSNVFTALQPLISAFCLGDNQSLGSQYAGHRAMPTGFATTISSAVPSQGNILSTNGSNISSTSAIQNSPFLAALTRTLGLTQTLEEHGSSDATAGGIDSGGREGLQRATNLLSLGAAQSVGSDNSAPESRQGTSQLSSAVPSTGNFQQTPNVQDLLNLGVAYGALAQQSPAACASLLALMQSNPHLPAPNTIHSTMHPVPPSSASSVTQVATSTSSTSSSDTVRQRNVNVRGGRYRSTFYSSGRVRGRGRRGFNRGGYFQSFGGFAGYAAPPGANYPVTVQPNAPAWPVPLQQTPMAWYPPTTPPPAMYPSPSYPYANGAYQSYAGPHRFY